MGSVVLVEIMTKLALIFAGFLIQGNWGQLSPLMGVIRPILENNGTSEWLEKISPHPGNQTNSTGNLSNILEAKISDLLNITDVAINDSDQNDSFTTPESKNDGFDDTDDRFNTTETADTEKSLSNTTEPGNDDSDETEPTRGTEFTTTDNSDSNESSIDMTLTSNNETEPTRATGSTTTDKSDSNESSDVMSSTGNGETESTHATEPTTTHSSDSNESSDVMTPTSNDETTDSVTPADIDSFETTESSDTETINVNTTTSFRLPTTEDFEVANATTPSPPEPTLLEKLVSSFLSYNKEVVNSIFDFFGIRPGEKVNTLKLTMRILELYNLNFTTVVPVCYFVHAQSLSLNSLKRQILSERKSCLFEPVAKIKENMNATKSDIKTMVAEFQEFVKDMAKPDKLATILKLNSQETRVILDLGQRLAAAINESAALILIPTCILTETVAATKQMQTELENTWVCIRKQMEKSSRG